MMLQYIDAHKLRMQLCFAVGNLEYIKLLGRLDFLVVQTEHRKHFDTVNLLL